MFTGLVQEIGTVEQISFDAMAELWIGASFADLKLGESIAVDGACLTVVEVRPGTFRVQASAETLRRTTLGSLTRGSPVNLERALSIGERLGGHIVLGHVDAVSHIVGARQEGGSRLMEFSLPPPLAPVFSPASESSLVRSTLNCSMAPEPVTARKHRARPNFAAA